MTASLRIVRAGARLQIAQLSANGYMLFTVVLQTFFIAVTAMYVLRHRGDFDPMFVVVGAGLSGLWSIALLDGGWAIQNERWQGTLELVAVSPSPLLLIVGGRLVGSMIFSLLSMVVSYMTGAWLFGYSMHVHAPLAFVAALALGVASLWATGMLLAPIGILWRTAQRFLGILEYPVYALSGFLFPILLLPGWSRPISYALPPYWAAAALHGAATGDIDAAELLTGFAIMVTESVIALAAARLLFGLVLRRARRDGTLSLT